MCYSLWHNVVPHDVAGHRPATSWVHGSIVLELGLMEIFGLKTDGVAGG